MARRRPSPPPAPTKGARARRGEGELDDAACTVSSVHERAGEQDHRVAVVMGARLNRRRRRRSRCRKIGGGGNEWRLGLGFYRVNDKKTTTFGETVTNTVVLPQIWWVFYTWVSQFSQMWWFFVI